MPVIIFFAFRNEANWVALRTPLHELSETIPSGPVAPAIEVFGRLQLTLRLLALTGH